MRYIIISNVKSGGKTYLPGETIELPEEVAKNLIKDGVLKGSEEPELPEDEDEKELEGLSYKELKDIADEKGIDRTEIKRSREGLIEAIKETE